MGRACDGEDSLVVSAVVVVVSGGVKKTGLPISGAIGAGLFFVLVLLSVV